MLTRYGFDVLWKYFLIAILFGSGIVILINDTSIKYGMLLSLAVLTLLVLNFFRDPARHPPNETGVVLSPADGKIVTIKEQFEPEYLKTSALQVSIFMSPLDVHVNRFPIGGTIEYFRHVEGTYAAAFDDKSSERNERTHIGVANDGYRVFFKQIAGAVARRIVADVKSGQQVKQGEPFGMIKFGSRVDLLMPKQSNIMVKVHDRVMAGESIIARYPATNEGVTV